MRFVQLRAFHNVAVYGGFSRAAEALGLTQPAISDQVRKLEEEYDILLFDRRAKQVAITPAGANLLAITNRLFDVEREALDYLSETRATKSGTLRIIADSAHHLLHILAPFQARYPGIFVSVKSGNSGDVIDQLLSYQADIGFTGEVPERRDLDVVRLSSSPIIAFAARDHAVAARSAISLADLAGYPLVLREQGSKTRRIFEEVARGAGIALAPTIEAEGREAVREIVAAGAGVGIVSEAEFGEDARLRKIAIDAQGLTMDETLISLKDRRGNKLIQAFIQTALGSKD